MRCLVVTACSFLVSCAVILGSGCGKQGAPLGTVRGTVTFDGDPLANARVVFRPAEGRTSVGTTDQDGRYALSLSPTRKGALVGEHSVAITWEPPDLKDADQRSPADLKTPSIMLPARYNSQTTLSANVKPGENSIDFDLRSK